MSYEFQLVLQLPEDCPSEDMGYEDDIARALNNPKYDKSNPHLVDGHSLGGGTVEFFVHTVDPVAAFNLCKPLLNSSGLLEMLVAAYRRLDGETFEVIWPMGYSGEFKLD